MVWDYWPDNLTVFVPQYFAVMHFNPGIVGSTARTKLVPYKFQNQDYTINIDQIDYDIDLISPTNIPVLVFTAYEISRGNNDETIVGKIKNNLFGFNTYDFGDTENDVDCEECSGSGEVSCSDCEGDGYTDCRNCDGNGEMDCPDCDGAGEDEEGNTCGNCEGSGKVT